MIEVINSNAEFINVEDALSYLNSDAVLWFNFFSDNWIDLNLVPDYDLIQFATELKNLFDQNNSDTYRTLFISKLSFDRLNNAILKNNLSDLIESVDIETQASIWSIQAEAHSLRDEVLLWVTNQPSSTTQSEVSESLNSSVKSDKLSFWDLLKNFFWNISSQFSLIFQSFKWMFWSLSFLDRSNKSWLSQSQLNRISVPWSYEIPEWKEFALDENWFLEIFSQYRNLDENDLWIIKTFMFVTWEQESNSNYNARWIEIKNRRSRYFWERAIGRYQIMPWNWNVWANDHFWNSNLEPNPLNQDKVAFAQMLKYYNWYKSRWFTTIKILEEMSKDWYWRWTPPPWHPTPKQYAESVLNRRQTASA